MDHLAAMYTALQIDRQTDIQTDRRQYHANSEPYCVQYDQVKIQKYKNPVIAIIKYHRACIHRVSEKNVPLYFLITQRNIGLF